MEYSLGLLLLCAVAVFADETENNEARPFLVENRIINGKIATPGLFPYMAMLYVSSSDDDGNEYDGLCGGSLISENFVLTAAHCVLGADYVKVFLGEHDTAQDSDPNRIEMKVKKDGIIVYEGYNTESYANDIALLKLPQKVKFTARIQPVRLVGRSQVNLEGQLAVISGWGNMEGNIGSDILRYAQVRILPNEVCQKFYRIYYHPTNMCLEGKTQSACSGDSGGPAVIADRQDGRFTQVGVTSYVSPRGCEKGHPFVYTRVLSFLNWIHEKTGLPIRE